MALHVMSLSSGASALMLFTWLGPVVLVVALAVIRSAFGPRLALRRLRRGRPARIRMWLSGPPGPEETVLRARLLRVDDDAHIIGAGFHWVVPASGLEVLDPAEPISVVHPGGGTDDLSIDPRWRAAFTLAVADDGPRWSAASRKSRWVGAPWWILPNAAIMAALAQIVRGS